MLAHVNARADLTTRCLSNRAVPQRIQLHSRVATESVHRDPARSIARNRNRRRSRTSGSSPDDPCSTASTSAEALRGYSRICCRIGTPIASNCKALALLQRSTDVPERVVGSLAFQSKRHDLGKIELEPKARREAEAAFLIAEHGCTEPAMFPNVRNKFPLMFIEPGRIDVQSCKHRRFRPRFDGADVRRHRPAA